MMIGVGTSPQLWALAALGFAVFAVGDRLAGFVAAWARRLFGYNDTVITSPPVRFSPGEEGEALTPLRPLGHGSFRGQRVAVRAPSQYIERGARIRIVRPEIDWYLVERVRRERKGSE